MTNAVLIRWEKHHVARALEDCELLLRTILVRMRARRLRAIPGGVHDATLLNLAVAALNCFDAAKRLRDYTASEGQYLKGKTT
jgi:hypothetical protein